MSKVLSSIQAFEYASSPLLLARHARNHPEMYPLAYFVNKVTRHRNACHSGDRDATCNACRELERKAAMVC